MTAPSSEISSRTRIAVAVKHWIEFMKCLIVALVTCVAIAAPSWADSFDDAYAAYNRGDFQTAFRSMMVLADAGDARAQFLVAAMYEANKAKSDSHPLEWSDAAAQAVIWYWRAAEQGNTDAQVVMADRYAEGRGVPHSLVEAAKWLSLAEAGGNDRASALLQKIRQRMTAEEIAESQGLAADWSPTPEAPNKE